MLPHRRLSFRTVVFVMSLRVEHPPADVASLRQAWVSFLARWSWDWFVTATFPELVHAERADKAWRVWVSQMNRSCYGNHWWRHGEGVRWVRASEFQKRGALHYHALIGGTHVSELRRLSWMDRWQGIAGGFARIEEPGSTGAVMNYCSKYVIKGGALDIGGPCEGEEIIAWLGRINTGLV